jgi:hypothetical protein
MGRALRQRLTVSAIFPTHKMAASRSMCLKRLADVAASLPTNP